MKKIIVASAIVAMALSSCTSVQQTASTRDVTAPVAAAALADFEVSSEKITYTYVPTRKVRKSGLTNCINAAISEALKVHGNADVLIETQQAIVQRTGIFAGKIMSVTVTGYPAKYKNFRSADEETVKSALIEGTLKGSTNNEKRAVPASIFGFLK